MCLPGAGWDTALGCPSKGMSLSRADPSGAGSGSGWELELRTPLAALLSSSSLGESLLGQSLMMVQDLGERNLMHFWEWKHLQRVGPGGFAVLSVWKNINIVVVSWFGEAGVC